MGLTRGGVLWNTNTEPVVNKVVLSLEHRPLCVTEYHGAEQGLQQHQGAFEALSE